MAGKFFGLTKTSNRKKKKKKKQLEKQPTTTNFERIKRNETLFFFLKKQPPDRWWRCMVGLLFQSGYRRKYPHPKLGPRFGDWSGLGCLRGKFLENCGNNLDAKEQAIANFSGRSLGSIPKKKTRRNTQIARKKSVARNQTMY